MADNTQTASGFGIGAIIAVVISWGLNHSVLWALVHGFLGWGYLAYWALFL